MIDLKFLRENPDLVRDSQRTRGEDPALVDELLAADEKRRSSIQTADELRRDQKSFGKKIGAASKEERPALLEEAKTLAARVKEAEAAQKEAAATVEDIQNRLANVVAPEVPAGGEDDFVELERVGEIPEFDFPVRDHLELAEMADIIDMQRGAKVSGSRFYFLKGAGALLEMALTQLAISKAVEYGFTVMIPPVLVLPEIMQGTGFNVEHDDEIYRLGTDDLYLVGTSEVALAGYHKDEILDLSEGPIRYAGYSSCFRREAGSYGKDTRGIIRVHQFNKVEMFTYCTPEQAEEEHQKLLQLEKEMLKLVEVPFRVIDIAGGDLGTSAARKFDCEAWVPSQNTFRELTSTSNCTTFQARRLQTRYRDEDGRTQMVATLNGTLATTRWLVAIMENHQQEDGSMVIPEALRPYMGGMEVISPK
ncbi:MAG TPA: serine--tRNA ligase [Corynebacteriales bacterium]|nr:serine--tRNA ligase [Mycobacteriales bacterium]